MTVIDPAIVAISRELFGDRVDPVELAKSMDSSDVHIDSASIKVPGKKGKQKTLSLMPPIQKDANSQNPSQPSAPSNKKIGLGLGLAAGAGIEALAAGHTVGPLADAIGGVKSAEAGGARVGGAVADAVKGADGVGNKIKALKPLVTGTPKGIITGDPTAAPAVQTALQAGNFAVGLGASKELLKPSQPNQPVAKGLKLSLKPLNAAAKRRPYPSLKAVRPAGSPAVAKSFDLTAEICKIDRPRQQVFGWANVSKIDGQLVRDRQGDEIDIEELEKAAYDYVLESRIGGDMHERIAKFDGVPRHTSDLIESIVFTPEKIEKMGLPPDFPQGWWIGQQIHDPQAWEEVASGRRTGFSVHGAGRRVPIEKADGDRKRSGAAIAGGGAVVAGTSAIAGGVPGVRPDGNAVFRIKHAEGSGVRPSHGTPLKRAASGARRAADEVRGHAPAAKATPGGILGFRGSIHEGGLYGFTEDHKSNTRAARVAKPKVEHFYHGLNEGKIAPEKAIMRGMKTARVLSHGTLAAGVGATAYGIHRARTPKPQPVVKSTDRGDTYDATLAGAGATGLAVAHGGAKYLHGQAHKFSTRASQHVDEAATHVPGLAGRQKKKMSIAQIGRYQRKYGHDAPHPLTMEPSVRDGEVGRNPALVRGIHPAAVRRAGELRGLAAQERHFSHVFTNTAHVVGSARTPAAVIGAVGAGGLLAHHDKNITKFQQDPRKKKTTLRVRADQAAHPPAVIRVPVKSTAVRSLGYQPQTRKLDVEMNSRPGQPYSYRVPKKVARKVTTADSKGQAYNQNIRGKAKHHDHYTPADRARLFVSPQGQS